MLIGMIFSKYVPPFARWQPISPGVPVVSLNLAGTIQLSTQFEADFQLHA